MVVSEPGGVQQYETRGTVSRSTKVIIEGDLPTSDEPLTAIRFTGYPKSVELAKRDSEWGFLISHIKASIIPRDGDATEVEIAFVVADEPNPLVDPQQSLNVKSSQGFGAYSRINYPRSGAFVLKTPVEIQVGDRLRVSLAQNTFELGAFPLVAHRGEISISTDKRFAEWWSGETEVAARAELAELRKARKEIRSVSIPKGLETLSL